MNVNTVSTFLTTGTVLIVAGLAALLILRLAAWKMTAAQTMFERVRDGFIGYGLWLAWLMSVLAMLGSLYYSQIAHFTPCEYCWYQRIAMYPLAIILGIAAFRNDNAVRRYVYPLAIIGSFISGYHYLIQRIPDLAAGKCSSTTPCTAALVWKFDFVSIPFMALVSFAVIVTVLALDRANARTATDLDAARGPEGAA
jgi:disulfide bond formation protein DsbB